MPSKKPQSKRKPRYSIENIKVTPQDITSVRSVMDKFLGRTLMPEGPRPSPLPDQIENISASNNSNPSPLSTTDNNSTTTAFGSTRHRTEIILQEAAEEIDESLEPVSVELSSRAKSDSASIDSTTISNSTTYLDSSSDKASTTNITGIADTTGHQNYPDNGDSQNSLSTTRLPSSTKDDSTSSNTSSTNDPAEIDESTLRRAISTPTMPSRTTKHGTTQQASTSRRFDRQVSPQRDFVKVPNSVVRDALAAGIFKGKSKQVWDYLWSESRGSINPQRSIRRSRPQIKLGAGLGSMVTLDQAIKHLLSVGLLARVKVKGESEGNHYEVFTPEETGWFSSPILDSSSGNSSTTQFESNSVALELPANSSTRSTSSPTGPIGYGETKTFLNTKTNDDDPFSELISVLAEASQQIIGTKPNNFERAKWGEVGRLIVDELKEATERTGSVSSVPGLLAAHLRRQRLTRQRVQNREVKSFKTDTIGDLRETTEQGEGRRLTSDKMNESLNMFRQLIDRGGYDLPRLTEQFAAGFHVQDWAKIVEKLQQNAAKA